MPSSWTWADFTDHLHLPSIFASDATWFPKVGHKMPWTSALSCWGICSCNPTTMWGSQAGSGRGPLQCSSWSPSSQPALTLDMWVSLPTFIPALSYCHLLTLQGEKGCPCEPCPNHRFMSKISGGGCVKPLSVSSFLILWWRTCYLLWDASKFAPSYWTIGGNRMW